MIGFLKRNSYQMFTFVLMLLLLFMHLYKLTEIPYGLNVDEASATYDAFCIANYGVDRWLDSYPVYFTNYADGQNALYIYLLAIVIKLFGISEYGIRAIITISSFIAVYLGYRYCEKAWNGRKVSWLFLGLYAILPVFTMTQRFGLESHLMLSAAIAVVYFVTKALETEKTGDSILAGCICGIALYTYALSYVVIPIFLLLMFIYGLRTKRVHIKNNMAFIIPFVILAIPLVIVQMVNILELQTLKIGPLSFPKLANYRSDEVGVNSIMQISERLKNIGVNTLCYDDCPYNSSSAFGTMYYVSLPFIVWGIVQGISNTIKAFKWKQIDYDVGMIAWLIGMVLMGCTLSESTVPNNTRMIGIFGVLLYFLVKGILGIYDGIKQWSLGRTTYILLLSVGYVLNFFLFVIFYFNEYNEKGYPFKWLFYEPYYEVKEYINENRDEEYIYRATCYPWNYIYYCLTYEVDPYDLNIPINGIDTYQKDFINGYPKEIYLERNYVVYHTDVDSRKILNELGYQNEELGKFSYFISPFENYVQQQNDCAEMYIDYIKKSKNQVIISGWCIDKTNQNVFTEVYIEADGERFDSVTIMREDIVGLYKNDKYSQSGFYVTVPKNIFSENDCIVLYGVDINGNNCVLYEWNEKEGKA